MAEEKQLANEEEKITTEAAQNTDAKEDTKEAAKEKTEETAEKKIFSKKKDKKTEKLEEKLAEYEDLRVRQLAEFENFRKRSEKEKAQMFEIGAKTVIEKLLPVIDNFERGLAAVTEDEKETPFAQGVELVYKQLLTSFDELGVKPIEAVGKEFDPNLHNAVMMVDDDSLESCTVAEEMQKGHRFYVDHLMQEKDREVKEMKDFVIEKTQKMDEVLKKVAKMLANNTNYATIVSAPTYSGNKVKFMQLSNVDEKHILAVIVMNSNMVKNQMIDVEEPLDNETLLKLNILLNTALNGLSLQEINLGTISKLKEQAGVHSEIVSHVLDALGQTLSENEDLQIYTSGATNILKYPELSDSESAAGLLSTFEEKDELVNLVTESLSEGESKGNEIQVYIGNEAPVQTMKDCSVVTATYDLGEGVKGTIGIVGPKRMDYENVVDNLKNLKSQLDGIFDKEKGQS